METLQDLLVEELKDIYSAEKQIVKALPKLVKAAENDSLKQALREHLEATKVQVTRLEEVFEVLEKKATAKHCKGMEGLLAEGTGLLEEEKSGTLRDLALIGACQRVEHYEVAAYGTARAMAENCGLDEAVALLSQTLEEEVLADTTLSAVAEELYVKLGGKGEARSGQGMASLPSNGVTNRNAAAAKSPTSNKGKTTPAKSTSARR